MLKFLRVLKSLFFNKKTELTPKLYRLALAKDIRTNPIILNKLLGDQDKVISSVALCTILRLKEKRGAL